MKTPVDQRPSPIGGVPDHKSAEGMSRYMGQVRQAVNFLLKAYQSKTTANVGVSNGTGSLLAMFGTNVVDAKGNLVETVGSSLIADGAIQENHLADESVSGNALQQGSVDSGHINSGAITSVHVAEQSLDDSHVIENQSLVASGGVIANSSTGALQIDLSKSASSSGAGLETVINNDTIYANDGAGLGDTADLTQTQNVPTTCAGAIAQGIMTDVQESIGAPTADAQVLRGYASTGSLTFDSQYHGESDCTGLYGSALMPGGNNNLTGSMATQGNALVIPNPGGFISLRAFSNLSFSSTGAVGDQGLFQIIISTDGGATFSTLAQQPYSISKTSIRTGSPVEGTWSGTPTGDIWLEVQGQFANGTGPITITASNSFLDYQTFAQSNGNAVGATALAVTIPSSPSVACSKNYPSTTCTVSKNIAYTVQGGKGSYSGAAAKVGGTGTVSGSTSNPFTVSDTETTADAGATHTTTVNVAVTDSQTYTMTPASESGTTVTGTLNGGGLIPVGAKVKAASGVPAGYNGTNLPVLTGTTGTTLKYTAGSSGLGALSTPATINNVTVTSSSCVLTATFTRTYSNVTAAINGSKSGNCTGNGSTCTVTLDLTVVPAGGDETYTESNTKIAGSFTIGGSTSANFTCSESGSTAGAGSSDTGTVQSQATDGHSNIGSKRAALTFNFINLN